jgi:hypothetical protein
VIHSRLFVLFDASFHDQQFGILTLAPWISREDMIAAEISVESPNSAESWSRPTLHDALYLHRIFTVCS